MDKYRFDELIEIEKIQKFIKSLYNISGIRVSLVDGYGNVMASSGRSKVCNEFHRKSCITEARCIESNENILKDNWDKDKKYVLSKCENGMCFVAIPVYVGNKHLATLFYGQFFLENPKLEFFKKLSEKAGFDEEEYMKAINEVEVIPLDELKDKIEYLVHFAYWMGEIADRQLNILKAKAKIKENYKQIGEVYNDMVYIEDELKYQLEVLDKKEKMLLENEEKYKLAIDGVNDGVWHIDFEDRKMYISNRGKKILGINEITNNFYMDKINEYECNNNNELFSKLLDKVIKFNKEFYQHKFKITDKNNNAKYVLCRGKTLRENNSSVYAAGSLTDITSMIEAQKETKKLAYYNSLTKLKNRAYAMDKMPMLIEKIKKRKQVVSLFILDIDNFKAINDTFGHNIGDEFLKETSARLKMCLKDEDEIYHIGGDEFLFFIKSAKNRSEITSMANDLLYSFKEPFYIENHEIYYITASIGISILEYFKEDFQTLFNHADDAMHCSKKMGKDRYKIYNSNMNSNLYYETRLQNDLKEALLNNEFKVYYQPKVDTSTGELSGVEALVRWIKHDGEIIPPNKFISFAETRGLIGYISEKVTREACIQNKKWQDSQKSKFRTAVNLSAFQLQDKELFEKIQGVLDETGLLPEFFEVEITESVIMKNFKQSIYTLDKLRDIGVKVSLDDFGTGYSSLNYLKTLPIDSIKLDKSFVDNLTVDSKERFIVSTIINLSHGVDLKVIAEGVESKEQLKILTEYNCDEIQGYYFSKPIPPEEFEMKFLSDDALK